MHPGAEIASLTRYRSEPMEDVAFAGGRLYLTVMCVSADTHIVEINGPIGHMNHELRLWLPAGGPDHGDRA
jgi:hypothetical protein